MSWENVSKAAYLLLPAISCVAALSGCGGSSDFTKHSTTSATTLQRGSIGAGFKKLTCDDPVFIGSGLPGWRRQSSYAGPFGLFGGGRDFRTILQRDSDGRLRTKTPAIIEGHQAVELRVPPRERRRVAIDVVTRDGGGPYIQVSFVPCPTKRRTIWPAGLVLRDRLPVTLQVLVETKRIGAIRVGRIARH